MTGKTARWLSRGLVLAAALWGLALVASGLYMPAKAWAGQILLKQAWHDGQRAPWPGADIRPVARLIIPKLDRELFVLDSASGKAMAWGLGHVQGTPAPGQPGLSAIGGHRDTHLTLLRDIGPGDALIVEGPAGTITRFQITHAEVVDSRTWRYPTVTEGPARLALTTCWPLEATEPGALRLVVYADAPHD